MKCFLLEIATDNDHNFRAIEEFGNYGNHNFGLDIQITDVEGFNTEGSGYSLVFNPKEKWPYGSISISLDDLVSTINIRGKIVEVVDTTI